MDRLKSLSILLRVAQTGSFSRCAEEMNLGQPTISRAVDALERELGVKILNRNTRSLSLTDEGKRVLVEAKKVVDSYNDLIAQSQSTAVPKGTIRVTCPTALGSIYVIPALRRFMKTNPQISVHLRISDSFLDLFENDIDVAIRVGELPSSQVIAKSIGRLARIAVANESYLKENAPPRDISGLSEHSCIVVNRTGSSSVWDGFDQNKNPFSIEINGRVVVDNHLALQTAVESGLGIGLASKFLFAEKGSLRKGLVQILKKVEFKPYPVNVLFKEAKSLPARTRSFVDFVYEDLRKQSWIET